MAKSVESVNFNYLSKLVSHRYIKQQHKAIFFEDLFNFHFNGAILLVRKPFRNFRKKRRVICLSPCYKISVRLSLNTVLLTFIAQVEFIFVMLRMEMIKVNFNLKSGTGTPQP